MVTGSADNTCKIWDVRMRRQIYTMSAHNNLVSRVRIDPSGEYLVTGSYDNTMKLWTCSGWQPLRIFDSHNMKVYFNFMLKKVRKFCPQLSDFILKNFSLQYFF